MSKIFEALGTDHPAYSYYFYYTRSGRKFMFISEKPIPFQKYDKTATCGNISTACFEKGLLFDLDKACFVLTKAEDCRSPETWPKFFIYDGGIPHVTVKTKDNITFYNIICWDNKHSKYTVTQSWLQPIIISHVNPDSSGEPTRKRILFATVPTKKNEISISDDFDTYHTGCIPDRDVMLVVDDDLSLIAHEKNVRYNDIVYYFGPRLTSNILAYQTLYPSGEKAEEHAKEDSSINEFEIRSVFHTFKDDLLIFESYKSELGEYTLVFLNDEFKIDYSLSCFSYTLFELTEDFKKFEYASDFFKENRFLIVRCRRNDFENISYAINLKTHAVFNYDVFLLNLSNMILDKN